MLLILIWFLAAIVFDSLLDNLAQRSARVFLSRDLNLTYSNHNIAANCCSSSFTLFENDFSKISQHKQNMEKNI